MDLSPTFATLATLKARAARLRAAAEAAGRPMGQSTALETLARASGCRDWSSLSIRAASAPDAAVLRRGDHVAGAYLRQWFTGEIRAIDAAANGSDFRISLRFDQPVDVIPFESMSNLRQNVTIDIGPDGVSPDRTSDGSPHLVLEL